jgi:hypothetical protein
LISLRLGPPDSSKPMRCASRSSASNIKTSLLLRMTVSVEAYFRRLSRTGKLNWCHGHKTLTRSAEIYESMITSLLAIGGSVPTYS